jgi:hypothetical protein
VAETDARIDYQPKRCDNYKASLARVDMESRPMSAAFPLMAQSGGKAIVQIEDVRWDYQAGAAVLIMAIWRSGIKSRTIASLVFASNPLGEAGSWLIRAL